MPKPRQTLFQKTLVILGYCLWTFVVFYALQFILAYPMYWILGEKVNRPIWVTVYSAIIYTLTLIIVIGVPHFLGKRRKKDSLISDRNQLGLKNLPTWTDIGLSIAGFVAYLALATVLTQLFAHLFPWFNLNQAQDTGYSNLLFGTDRIIALISLVIIAPIAEEIIFRGFLYYKIKSTCKKHLKQTKQTELLSITISALITSIVFGILHGQWNVGVNVFAMSIVLCAQREITGTIYSGIIMHMLKNAIAFYLLYIIGFGY